MHSHKVYERVMEAAVGPEPECRVHNSGHLRPRSHNVRVDSIFHGEAVAISKSGVSVLAKLFANLELDQPHDYLLGLQLVVFENVV